MLSHDWWGKPCLTICMPKHNSSKLCRGEEHACPRYGALTLVKEPGVGGSNVIGYSTFCLAWVRPKLQCPNYILYPTLAVGLTLLFYAFLLHHFTSTFRFLSLHVLMVFQLDFLNSGCEVVEVLVLTDPHTEEFVFLKAGGSLSFRLVSHHFQIFTFQPLYWLLSNHRDKMRYYKFNNIFPLCSFLKDSPCLANETFGCAGLIDPSSLGHFYCFNIFHIGLDNLEVCLKPFITVCLLGVAAFPESQSN